MQWVRQTAFAFGQAANGFLLERRAHSGLRNYSAKWVSQFGAGALLRT